MYTFHEKYQSNFPVFRRHFSQIMMDEKAKIHLFPQRVDFARMRASVWPRDDTVGETRNERKGLLTWLIFGWLGIAAVSTSRISC